MNTVSTLEEAVEMVLQNSRRDSSSKIACFEEIGFRQNKEVVRVKDFVCLLLEGVDRELEEKKQNAIHSDKLSNLEREAEEAKCRCVSVLLALGHTRPTFLLACRFHCFQGMMDALESSSGEEVQSFTRELVHQIREKGHLTSNTLSRNTSTAHAKASLSEYVLQRLWEAGRLETLLEIGAQAVPSAVLETFLKDKPSLAWVHNLDRKDFSSASAAALAHATAISDFGAKGTLLSIAKLSARAAGEPRCSMALETSLLLHQGEARVKEIDTEEAFEVQGYGEDAIMEGLLKGLKGAKWKDGPFEDVSYLCFRILEVSKGGEEQTVEYLKRLLVPLVLREEMVWAGLEYEKDVLLEKALRGTVLFKTLERAMQLPSLGLILRANAQNLAHALETSLEQILGPKSLRLLASCIEIVVIETKSSAYDSSAE